jgi:hypothetical protein
MGDRKRSPAERQRLNDLNAGRNVQQPHRPDALPRFKNEVDGLDIHYIHVESAHTNACSLIVTHG